MGIGAILRIVENSVSLPQSPSLGIFLAVGHRKSRIAMFTKKSEPQEWIRSSLESRVRSCPRHHFSNFYHSWRVRVRKSIAVWSLLKFPIKCSKTQYRAALKTRGKQGQIHLWHSSNSQEVLVRPGFLQRCALSPFTLLVLFAEVLRKWEGIQKTGSTQLTPWGLKRSRKEMKICSTLLTCHQLGTRRCITLVLVVQTMLRGVQQLLKGRLE